MPNELAKRAAGRPAWDVYDPSVYSPGKLTEWLCVYADGHLVWGEE